MRRKMLSLMIAALYIMIIASGIFFAYYRSTYYLF
jgi:hypothetical protein